MRLKTVEVKRFRSIMDAKVEFYKDQPVVICGQNNIGKTNFLLALNLFFNHWYDDSTFEPSRDIPDHIKNGSGGKTNNTEISCTFESDGVVIFEAKAKFNNDCSITYYKREFFEGEWDDFEQIDDLKFYELVSDFEFILIKSNNVDIPKMISKILGDVLL
ncbi:AAA family ATPase [Shewanella fodinae]|uniref:AAA ATPase-like protein n=1 Tax=Shewanella fodinae TaxID=552357 RepID=A0A4R2F801_9GAMM|nr:AAA family ATPase [Shewanella fodinae]TCN78484.1 AAA ATPase-like protein [Shewanella fodinae]